MKLRSFFIPFIISALVMSIAWELMEQGKLPSDTLQGKFLISFGVILISKIISKLVGG